VLERMNYTLGVVQLCGNHLKNLPLKFVFLRLCGQAVLK
jgi:hypothetical protein